MSRAELTNFSGMTAGEALHSADAALCETLQSIIERRSADKQFLSSVPNTPLDEAKIELTIQLLRNVLHSSAQGLGLGGVLTSVDFIQMLWKQTENSALNETIESLIHNANAARAWLKSIETILNALQKNYSSETLSIESVSDILRRAAQKMEPFRQIKGQRLEIHPVSLSAKISFNADALELIWSEVLLNAYKFAPANSRIDAIAFLSETHLVLALTNCVEPMGGGVTGIPKEYETKIFDPFFRLNNTWDDRFQGEPFGLGVGLTLSRRWAFLFGASLALFEESVLENGVATQKIFSTLAIPLVELTSGKEP